MKHYIKTCSVCGAKYPTDSSTGDTEFINHLQYGKTLQPCYRCGQLLLTDIIEPAIAKDVFIPKKGLLMSNSAYEKKIEKYNRMMQESVERLKDTEYALLLKRKGFSVPDEYLPENEQSKAGKKAARISAEESAQNAESEGKYKDTKKGEIITLGVYNGIPIKWRVLDHYGDYVLVISQYGICKVPFYTGGSITTDKKTQQLECSDEMKVWNASIVRDYLNYKFYDAVFSDDEKESISYPVDGRQEEDRLFLMNRADIQKYFDSDHDALVAHLYNSKDAAMYWIKGITRGYCNAIGYRGNIVTSVPASDNNVTVRPMMWIKG